MSLTLAGFTHAAAKLRSLGTHEDSVALVHPLTYLLECRGVGPLSYDPRKKHSREIYDQTFADYYGWGINQ